MIDSDTTAGPELDQFIAERWMGEACTCVPGTSRILGCAVHGANKGWSTNHLATWAMLDRWQGDVDLRRQNDQWRCELFLPSHEWEAWGECAPLAVCRAIVRHLQSPPQ